MLKLLPIAGGEEPGSTIDPEQVLDAIEQVGEDGKPKPPAPEPVKPTPAQPARVVAAAAEDKADASLRLAWSLAEDYVAESCPDLDDETKALVKKAAGNDPVAFKNEAKKMQAKMAALKAPKDPNDPDVLAAKLGKEVFGDKGGGGDEGRHPATKEPTPEERIKTAQEKKDSAGLQRATVDLINKGKDGKPMFPGVQMVID